jgi:hypothetical protein
MLTPAAFAAHLGISVRQLQRLDDAGLPSVPVGVRGKRYDAPACQAWLEANRDTIAQCLSTAPKKAATRSLSASVVSDFTDAYRRAHLRVTPSGSSQS